MNKTMKDLEALEKKLGIKFKKREFIEQALVHRSYLNENPTFPLGHNERLEFLGDAVLELVITEYLYRNYSNSEGELTNWRASLVNSKMLAEIAEELKLDTYLYLSRGEAKEKNTKARAYIMANAVEAIIGAVYIDRGFSQAEDLIHKLFLPRLPYILENELYRDPKSSFQEAAQEKVGVTPSYRVLEETGPDHAKIFTIGVFLADELVAKGNGASKQEGEEAAAKEALKVKSW